MLSDLQFDRSRGLAMRLAGIELFERHRELLHRRCRRMGMSLSSLDSLLDAAEQGDLPAGRQVVNLVTTKFTGFFRHPAHFEIAARRAFDAAQRKGQARLWSVATATGEEAYSLAMALIEVFPRGDPPASIRATDVNEEALAVAQRGEYGETALGALTPERRARFFSESAGPARWRLAPAARGLVEFSALNVVGPVWSIPGPMDVIFCRNVLMYLESSHRCRVLERIASLLAPDGLLVLDPVEDPGPARHLFTAGNHGVFFLRSRSATDPTHLRSPIHPLKVPPL